ncbi:AAA family ATPase [Spirochaeta isovalerica]|uniref:Energy-coupling factor transporter ATP-binding protein EcfA2 n=1 Tax=Spirochaeta isovalerica TaxID=150 RepID=A0A841RF30_9SPIO|nr:AAA family ATPase [Spirochaeta isovalerica]MBB6481991.1 energy-coupling factor transporter ATP-binding protein EcfA2 [Spirochaeta isovalerica]
MKYINIEIVNVKRFRKLNVDLSDKIQCIAGKNGCGKSTLFKALHFIEQVYIYQNSDLSDHDNFSEIEKLVSYEFNDYFHNKKASIKFTYSIDAIEYYLELKAKKNGDSYIPEFKTNDSEGKISEYWNVDEPDSLFLYILPYKTADETTYGIDKARINNKKNNGIIDALFFPEEIYKNAYITIIENHIYERISPHKPSRNHQFQTAFNIFKLMFPKSRFQKISANNSMNEFFIMGKSESGQNYDIRNFSAGEKATLLTIFHLIYLQKFSIICLDEFENHFHEELLRKLYIEFISFTKQDNLFEYMKTRNVKIPLKSEKYYKSIKFNTFIFLTHSKYLMRLNEKEGENFIINEGVSKLINNDINDSFIKYDISQYNQYILYVEGDTDKQLFKKISALNGIEIRSAGSCDEVIKIYKNIQDVKNELSDTKVVFLVDGDSIDSIEELKQIDEPFFINSFLCIDMHELENSLIDAESIYNWIYNNRNAYGLEEDDIKLEDIETIINSVIDDNKDISIKKLALLNIEDKIKKHVGKILNLKTIKSETDWESIIQTGLKTELNDTFIDNTVYNSKSQWETKWDEDPTSVVDGKIALNIIISKLRSNYNLPNDSTTPYLKYISNEPSNKLSMTIRKILHLFQIKGIDM